MCKESTVWVLRKYYIYVYLWKLWAFNRISIPTKLTVWEPEMLLMQMLFCGNHLKAAMFQTLSFKNCFNTTKKMDRLKCCLHTPLFFQLVVDIPKVAWNIRQQFVYSFSTGQLARNDHESYSHRMDIFLKGVKLTNPLPAVISSGHVFSGQQLKSLISEATPLATHSLQRSCKNSCPPQL